MAKQPNTLNVSLTPAIIAFVEARVASGHYQTASEVVREAMRLLLHDFQLRQIRIGDLRREIQLGVDQLDRGEGIDGDEAMADITRQLQARKPGRRVRPKKRRPT